MSEKPRFHAGGSLPAGALYVERPADGELCAALLGGEFCYVLAPRQIGKSSLRVRTARWLKERDVLCATVDLTRIGGTSTGADPEQWYYGLIEEISRKLKLPHPMEFWSRQLSTTPVHRFVLYLRGEVLERLSRRVVIFIDEIDSLLALPFSTDDFFAAVRDAYNARAEDEAYERLTFCLMGVATPGELIKNPARTPFNIGRGIRLLDFTAEEARALLPGLQGWGDDPERLLQAVLHFTSGHPYMTQRVCEALIRERERERERRQSGDGGENLETPEERVGRIVGEVFLRRGRSEEPNLTYAESRLEQSHKLQELLRLYRRLLDGEHPIASQDDPVQLLLHLTGMAAEDKTQAGTVLRVRNRIFATVFDQKWVKEKERRALFSEPLLRWQEAKKQEDFLLRGQALHEAIEWARGREDVSPEEHEFLLAGLELARREEEERRKAAEEERRAELERERRERLELVAQTQRRSVLLLTMMVVVLSGLLVTVIRQYHKVERAEEEQRKARAAEAQAREQAQEVSLVERGLRAALLSRQPGEEVSALVTGIRAVGPSLKEGREPLLPALQGLTAASSALLSSMPLRGHGAAVQAASFSPDSQRLVTASLDRTARLWDPMSGQVLSVLRGHTDGVLFAGFSPDGRRLLTTSRDHTARLWDGAGRILFVLRGHAGPVGSGAFSLDGRRLATASEDGSVRLWNVATGRLLAVLKGHGGPLRSVAFSPDSRRLVAAGAPLSPPEAENVPFPPAGRDAGDHVANVFDVRSGALLFVLSGHTDGVLQASFSPDSKRVVTASRDHTARIWDAESGRPLSVLRGHTGSIQSAIFSPDGSHVITASLDGSACTWDVATSRPQVALHGHTGGIVAVAFSPDGRRVVTASTDTTARVWDADSGALLLALQGHNEALLGVAFSSDGGRILTASEDHTARLWNNAVRASRILKGHTDRLLSASFSPDGKRVVTTSADRSARIWDPRTGEVLATLTGHTDRVYSAVFSPDGQRVLTASRDHTARIWDPQGAREVAQLRGHQDSVWSAVYSRDGTRVLTTGADGNACIFSASTFALLHTLRGGLHAAALSPRGDLIATAGVDGTARLWNASTYGPVQTLRGHAGSVWAVAFSPSGALLATASKDRTARIWDMRTGNTLAVFSGHADEVISVSFSPDGNKLVTTSLDRSARVWDVTSGAHLALLPPQAEDQRPILLSASFSPDSKRLLTGCLGKTARLWSVVTGQRLATLRGHLASSPGGNERRLEDETGLPASYLARGGVAASFSPDGTRVVAILGETNAWVQPVTVKAFFTIACGLLRHQPELQKSQPPREYTEAADYCVPYFGKAP